MNEGSDARNSSTDYERQCDSHVSKKTYCAQKIPRVGNPARIRLAITDNVSVADGPLRELNELVGDRTEPRRRVEETTALVERRALAEQPLNETEKLENTEIRKT